MTNNKIQKKQHVCRMQGATRVTKRYFWIYPSPTGDIRLTCAPRRGYDTLPTTLSSTYTPKLSLWVEVIASSFPLKRWMEDEVLLILHFCELKFRVQHKFHAGGQTPSFRLPGEHYIHQQWMRLRQRKSPSYLPKVPIFTKRNERSFSTKDGKLTSEYSGALSPAGIPVARKGQQEWEWTSWIAYLDLGLECCLNYMLATLVFTWTQDVAIL